MNSAPCYKVTGHQNRRRTKSMKTKTIKVIYSTRQSRNNQPLPKIQIEGNWLEALGFHVGNPLQVEYEEGSIHIRTLTEEELNAKKQQELQAELKHKTIELKNLKSNIETISANLRNAAKPQTPCVSQPQPAMVCEPQAPFADSPNSKN